MDLGTISSAVVRGPSSAPANSDKRGIIAAHRTEPKQGGTLDGKPYEFTKYGATLTVYVPRLCPCCGD